MLFWELVVVAGLIREEDTDGKFWLVCRVTKEDGVFVNPFKPLLINSLRELSSAVMLANNTGRGRDWGQGMCKGFTEVTFKLDCEGKFTDKESDCCNVLILFRPCWSCCPIISGIAFKKSFGVAGGENVLYRALSSKLCLSPQDYSGCRVFPQDESTVLGFKQYCIGL